MSLGISVLGKNLNCWASRGCVRGGIQRSPKMLCIFGTIPKMLHISGTISKILLISGDVQFSPNMTAAILGEVSRSVKPSKTTSKTVPTNSLPIYLRPILIIVD